MHFIVTLTHLYLTSIYPFYHHSHSPFPYPPYSTPITPLSSLPSTYEIGSFTKVYMSATLPESLGLDSVGSMAANFARTDEEEKMIEFFRFSYGSVHVSHACSLSRYHRINDLFRQIWSAVCMAKKRMKIFWRGRSSKTRPKRGSWRNS